MSQFILSLGDSVASDLIYFVAARISTIILFKDTVNFEDVGVSVSIPKQELDQGIVSSYNNFGTNQFPQLPYNTNLSG